MDSLTRVPGTATRDDDFFADGPMGAAMRAFDWASSPLGPVHGWPRSLRTVVRLMLDSRYAMWLAWGPELTFFCNDAYRPTLGRKEGFIGAPAARVWAEIWPDIGPRIERVLTEGRATWDEGLLLYLERRGFKEETYHSFSYSPVRGDDGAVQGMLCVVTEDTERTIGERRLAALGALSSAALGARSVAEACRRSAESLAQDALDIPFLIVFLLDDDQSYARPVASMGLPAAGAPSVQRIVDDAAPWPLAEVLRTGRAQRLHDLADRLGELRAKHWPEPVTDAFLLPLARPGHADRLAGFMVAGLSPRLPFDAAYERFLTLAAAQVGNAIADARVFEEEQRRADELAALDRAKTAFFTNVSHEFRTPLALILGPLEELTEEDITPSQRALAKMAKRNALRLLKLVNTLLDFARVEGGRADARFAPVDLSALTADLASSFRSACDRAGLALAVDCPALPQPVFVDVDMWEKIVLNLLSNAFKYTTEGGIGVAMRATPDGSAAELEVADSGIGIAEADLPKLFRRFQRIEGAHGRSIEGSGIGLSLIGELAKLHGATIDVRSALGHGTAFTVRVPFGHAHLPPDRVSGRTDRASSPGQVAAFVGEALNWLHDPADTSALDSAPGALDALDAMPKASRPRVLIADDNADLRAYLQRLLAGRYRVSEAADGTAALQAALADPPDVLVGDVMMPGLDGFALVARLRADARTRALPVILLSARAGEEARVEGLARGADDYLVKPFSGRELLARVGAQVAAARVRREATTSIAAVVEQSLVGVARTRLDGRFTEVNARFSEIVGREAGALHQLTLSELAHPEDRDRAALEFGRLQQGEQAAFVMESRVLRPDGSAVWIRSHVNLLRDSSAAPAEAVVIVLDITDRKASEGALERSQALLSSVIHQLPLGLGLTDRDGRFVLANSRLTELIPSAIPSTTPDRRDRWRAWDEEGRRVPADRWPGQRALRGEHEPGLDFLYVDELGSERWMRVSSAPLREPSGAVTGAIIVLAEVTEQRRAQDALRASERLLRETQQVARLGSWEWDAASDRTFASDGLRSIYGIEPGSEFPNFAEQRGTLYPEHSWHRLEAAAKEALETRQGYALDVEARRAGKSIWITTRCEVVRDGDDHPVGLRGTVQDITERKLAELALEHSEALLRQQLAELEAIQEAAPLGMATFDREFRFRRINSKLAEMNGLPAAAHIGRTPHEVVPLLARAVDGVFRRVATTGKPERFELRGRTPAQPGVERIWEEAWYPLVDAAKGVVGVGVLVDEVTEQRRAQEELRAMERRKDEFLATLSHELRNPLAPIRTGLHLLRVTGPDAAKAKPVLDSMERQVRHLVRLVDDLMEVSRITRGKVELKRQLIDLTDVVRQAAEIVGPKLRSAGHALDLRLPTEAVPLEGDTVRLTQVFANLLDNAGKYSDEGSSVVVTVEETEGQAVVTVRDRGAGIPVEMLDRVFDLFTQVDRTLGRAQGGLGIGLALVKSLVELHGGTVEARSEGPGRGSEFVVRLPLISSQRTLPAARPSAGEEPQSLHGLRVLVVDDNRDAADALAALLGALGGEVRTAADGAAGLAAVRSFRPAVVLLDLGMPGMDGYAVARQLRSEWQYRSLRLIALTGWGQEEHMRRTREAGFDDHLVKPVEPERLVALLRAAP